ncbi:hypothetical protein C7S16_3913 [Burkholderia thailandensis]|uniref:Uncharacterized protein n=1 Tax=Burkholderia thailandensis TaxID=57975 RepID=A0AAW9D5Z1_BURTH|nr:hypothetical protein [Burkholderia thailandensis]MDW9257236.1 hypothetical protein [Burkholderia thailandensis]
MPGSGSRWVDSWAQAWVSRAFRSVTHVGFRFARVRRVDFGQFQE